MKVIFTCGGTAGHINPAVGVAGKLKEITDPCEVLFIGAENNMEMELVPREGYAICPIRITNLSRGHDLEAVKHNIDTVKNVLLSTRAARKIIREFQPDVVVGTGGYVCYPVLVAAHELGIPTVIHESNAAPGLTTKLLTHTVDRILVGVEDCRDLYPDPSKVIFTGTPVRGAFSSGTRQSAREVLGISEDEKLVLSVWGSLGAGRMNEIILNMIPTICRSRSFRLVHATGAKYYEDFSKRLAEKSPENLSGSVDVRPYIHEMACYMTAADLVICRAGASTLSELTAMGKPAILVPSPNVTNNHQEKNARVLEKAGGARVLTEEGLNEDVLYHEIESILSDNHTLESMGNRLKSLSCADSSDRICNVILQLVKERL